jgi:hypothetical protein
MPFRDNPEDDDGYQFARQKKNKIVSARDRKRQLEERIRTSMQSLNTNTTTSNNTPIKNEILSSSSVTTYQSPYQGTSYQSCGEGSYGGISSSRDVQTQYHSANKDHVTNAPLGGARHAQDSPGLISSLVQCVSTAIGVGTSEIVGKQPSALYESVRSAVSSRSSEYYYDSDEQKHHSAISYSHPHNVASSGGTIKGSYQTVNIPSYHHQTTNPR